MSTLYGNCSRRTYLSTLLAPLFGGCFSDDDSVPRLDSLTIFNVRNVESNITVSINQSGTRVYKEIHHLEPVEGNAIDAVEIDEPWMSDKDVHYEVMVDEPDMGEHSYTTKEFLEMAGNVGDTECFGLTVQIESELIDFLPFVNTDCEGRTS